MSLSSAPWTKIYWRQTGKQLKRVIKASKSGLRATCLRLCKKSWTRREARSQKTVLISISKTFSRAILSLHPNIATMHNWLSDSWKCAKIQEEVPWGAPTSAIMRFSCRVRTWKSSNSSSYCSNSSNKCHVQKPTALLRCLLSINFATIEGRLMPKWALTRPKIFRSRYRPMRTANSR